MKRRVFLMFVSVTALLASSRLGLGGELIYFQNNDSQSTYGPSQFWPATGVNSEVADDFEVVAAIDRVEAGGFIWGVAPQWNRVSIRFYEYRPDGTPGALQQEYVLVTGDPGLTVSDTGLIDAVLSPPFQATGRHFLSVQPEVNYWYWWSSATNAPRGQAFYFRDLAAGQSTWQHGDNQPYTNFNADVEFALYGTTTGAGTITNLSAPSLTRSGYLEIFGVNFGGDGTVLVGGAPAPIAAWTSTRIVAYVPEASPLGPVSVQVVNSGGPSNTKPLEVTLRQATGRVNWRLRMEGMYSIVRPARGEDGTIYSIDVGFRLYAVRPDGALKWIVRGAGNKGLTLGPDGTIYTASESDVSAYNPDGTLKWTYTFDPRAFIMLGPNVGPDGNIYGVAVQSIGVFSLTPAGILRWSTPENYSRPITDYAELSFGPNNGKPQLYFTANNHTRAVRLDDGASIFTIGRIGKPEVSPLDGTVHGSSAVWTPAGQNLWSFTFPIFTGYISACELANDGTHYVVNRTFELYALDPGGNEKWHVAFPSGMGSPNIDPGNTMLVIGSSSTLNYAGFVVGFDLATRKPVWQVDLPLEDPQIWNSATGQYGFNQYVDTRTRFAADGSAVYLVTAIATGGMTTDRCFLYSIATGATSPPSPPPTSSILRVTGIDLSARVRKTQCTVTGLITVRTGEGGAVSGAGVSARWNLPNSVARSVSGLTDSRGVVKFATIGSPGTYTLTVTDVTRSGCTFDPEASLLTRSVDVTAPASSDWTAMLSVRPVASGQGSWVTFSTADHGRARISIYSVTGRQVRALMDEELVAGAYERIWDGRDDSGVRVGRGVYFVRFVAGDQVLTTRMIVSDR